MKILSSSEPDKYQISTKGPDSKNCRLEEEIIKILSVNMVGFKNSDQPSRS